MTGVERIILLDQARMIEDAISRGQCARLAVQAALSGNETAAEAISLVLDDAFDALDDVAKEVRLIGLGRERT